MTLTIADPSRLPIVQQSSEASQLHELLGATHAHAITTPTTATQTPLSRDVVPRLPDAGGWTRFLCCVSSQDTAHPA